MHEREDVTARRLGEVGHEGLYVAMGKSMKATPGARITKTERAVFDKVPPDGLHIGRVSKALLYAPEIKHLAYSKPERAALIKLLKRGLLRVERDRSTDEEYLVRVSPAQNPPRRRRNVRRAVRTARGRVPGRRRINSPTSRVAARAFTLNNLRVEFFQGYAEHVYYLREADGKGYQHKVETDAAELYLCDHPEFGHCLLIVDPSGTTPLWK